MDPEELYRLIEEQQENIIHVKGIRSSESNSMNPNDIYQYLNDYRPIDIPVEVTCGVDEAPEMIILPSLSNLIAVTGIVFVILISFYNLRLFSQRIMKMKSITTTGTDLPSLVKNMGEAPYHILIWTQPNYLISCLSLILDKIEISTQRLYICDNSLAIVTLTELQLNVQATKLIFRKLLIGEESFAKSSPRDDDELLFILQSSHHLKLLRDRLRVCEQILDNFISTKNSVLYELNKARADENVRIIFMMW